MATESVAVKRYEHGPAVFSMFDESVFIGWALAVSDLLACVNKDQCGDETIAEAGGLMYSLLLAAKEVGK